MHACSKPPSQGDPLGGTDVRVCGPTCNISILLLDLDGAIRGASKAPLVYSTLWWSRSTQPNACKIPDFEEVRQP